jgi:pyoverdine/dityrosine biosynthesis protein Dit1
VVHTRELQIQSKSYKNLKNYIGTYSAYDYIPRCISYSNFLKDRYDNVLHVIVVVYVPNYSGMKNTSKHSLEHHAYKNS